MNAANTLNQHITMKKFYLANNYRFIHEYTNNRYSRIENDFGYNPYTKHVILTNIEKMFSLVKSGLIPVDEYMNIISNIVMYTYEHNPDTQIIENYCNVFNNSIIDIDNLTINTSEYKFNFESMQQLLTFMNNELSLYSANTYNTPYIHENIK